MANSVDPDQTATVGAVCSGFTLFASIPNSSVMLGIFFVADDFSRRQSQMHFLSWRFKGLGPLTVVMGITAYRCLYILKNKVDQKLQSSYIK